MRKINMDWLHFIMIDLNARGQHGLTLLHYDWFECKRSTWIDSISLWLIWKQEINMDWLYFIIIDLNTKDHHGLTLFHYPCKKGSIFIFHFETPCFLATDLVIIRSGENISQSRILHPKKGDKWSVELLLYCNAHFSNEVYASLCKSAKRLMG